MAYIGSSTDETTISTGTIEQTKNLLGYDVVYIDLGGLSGGSDGLLESVSLLSAIENALEPRCIVIKSLCMRRLVSSLISFYELQNKEREVGDGEVREI